MLISPAGITFVKGFGGPGDTPSWTADDGVGSTGRTYTVGTQTPITFTDKVGMGTDATDGVTVTDMLRDIQSSVSTEGMMEKTTYILNGQVVGYSETEAMMATDPGGYTPPAGGTSSNIELYDANNERVGSYNKQGDGGYNLNLTVKTNADVDLNGDDTVDFGDNAASDKEYFVEIMKNAYMMMEGTTSTLQENETVNYYKVATVNGEEQADMSASGKLGSEQTFDGVTSIYDGNGASLGQKSSVDFTDAAAAAAAGIREVADAEFAELPASFKAASGKTYVREETFGDAMQQSTEATYMDDKGKALGYAYGNSDTYTDPVTQKTVTNSNLNFQSAEREPLGSIRMDGMGETRKVIEFIDNQNGDKKVDIDSDSTTGDGDGNEITLLGVIRVETETETPFKVDASGAVTNQLETAPVSTMTHYFNIANDDHLGGIEVDGATTVLVGPNWAYGAAQTDVNKLALTPADMNALPAEFVEYVLDPSDSAGAQTFDIKVKVVSDKFVFTKGTSTDVWDPSVDGINELDTYVFDTSDPSMKGYMLGFSTAKDNAGDDAKALTSAEGVTVSDKDPGEAGAKTTLVLPAGYGGVNNTNVTELHIYGAEQQGGPETVTITVTSASPFTFKEGTQDLTAFSFVDGNTYEFDVSAMTAVGSLTVNKTVAIVKDPDDISAGSVVQMGPTDGSTLSYTHVATTDDLYVVGVDITDPLNPALIPTADDNLEIGDVGSEAQPAATQLAAVPITYTDKVGMGTDATDGVAVTDMLRDIQSSVSTEGAMEKTTYILNGQVVGYSETEAMMATDPGGYTPPAGGYTCWWHLK